MNAVMKARLLLVVVLVVGLSGCATGSRDVYQVGMRVLNSGEYANARLHLQNYLSGDTESYEAGRARYELARLMYLGLGGPKDERAAAGLLEQELEKPFSVDERAARHLLAEIYLRGQGVDRNVDRVVELLRAADYPRATIDLAMIYWAGNLLPQDRKQAAAIASQITNVDNIRMLFRHRALADLCAPDSPETAPAWACLDEADELIVRTADEIWQSTPPDAGMARMEYLAKLHTALVDPGFESRAGWYRYAAGMGSARAQFRLALICGAPDSPWYNPEEANLWLNKSAQQGFAKAQLARGVELVSGPAVGDEEYLKALDWLARAADQGETEANLWLAHLYLNPVAGRPQQPARAIERLEQIAREDDRAKHGLADLYLSGRPGATDTQRQRAIELLESMAYRDVEAAFKLGAVYSAGIGNVEPSLVDAVRWLERAADKGHLPAQVLLAQVLRKDGRSESAAKARERFVFMPVAEVPESLRTPVSNARFRQAIYYSRLQDATSKSEQIVQLLELASEEQNLPALAHLGLMYYRGELVARDYELAYQYLERWDSRYQQQKERARSDDSVWSGLMYDQRFGNDDAQDALMDLRLRELQK
ncbi:SEL1-like repeat protein [Marinobacter sp. VGCF2001]|uniref:SEL1-like repeat protein n=1 Tax=Marinobacter sp. VGCF2001 TaxID=3417189 RepID=UPI003CEE6052